MASATYHRVDVRKAAVLLVDHQTGLLNLVRDFAPDEFRNNVLALADATRHFKLPVILTTSFEDGPNGPLMPELRERFPDAPYIARPGQINAWDNADFVKAVKATGRKQLIIAGIVTDVCVAFPTLSALEAGYEVYVCTDASGTLSVASRDATLLRLAQSGAQLETWFALVSELQRDWRHDPAGLAKILADHVPAYESLIHSYAAARPQAPSHREATESSGLYS